MHNKSGRLQRTESHEKCRSLRLRCLLENWNDLKFGEAESLEPLNCDYWLYLEYRIPLKASGRSRTMKLHQKWLRGMK